MEKKKKKSILVIGASGFVGRHLVRGLVAEGHAVRCLARAPERVRDLASCCEVARGDIADVASLTEACVAVDAVYVSVHTLSPQSGQSKKPFTTLESDGIANVVAACKARNVRRLVYITSLGMSPDGAAWVRGRWKIEQALLDSTLDATVLRPGMIVGKGGLGFGVILGQAKRRLAVMLGSGQNRSCPIAIDDFVYYLVGVLDDERAFGHAYDVGSDDVLTRNEMVDSAASVLGRRAPWKIRIPLGWLRLLAPLLERVAKMPRGAARGIVDALDADLVGDTAPIRALLPRIPLTYREAVARVVRTDDTARA